MKKIAFALVGMFAGLATLITASWAVHGNSLFLYVFPLGFGYGAYCAFRKIGRLPSAPKAVRPKPAEPAARPWER